MPISQWSAIRGRYHQTSETSLWTLRGPRPGANKHLQQMAISKAQSQGDILNQCEALCIEMYPLEIFYPYVPTNSYVSCICAYTYIVIYIYMYIVYIIIIYICVFIMYCIWILIYSRVCLPNMNFISPWSDSPGDSVLSGVIGGESTAWLVRPGASDANDLRWFFINGVVGKFIVHPQKNRTVIQALLYRNSVLFWKGSMKIFQSSILGFYMFWIVFGVWSWGKTGGQTMRNKWAVRCFFYLSG